MLIFATVGFFCADPAKSEPITVAILGDSLVQGYGLLADDGFVSQLNTWLSDRGQSVNLINAGVSGDTTAGGLSRIGWTLSPDVDALVISLGGNDALRGIDPALVRQNLAGILTAATASSVPVLLVGITSPANYGPEYRVAFSTIFPDLAAAYDTLFYPNFLHALAQIPDRSAALRNYFQPDAIHPNTQGVALIVNDIGPSVIALVGLAIAD